MKNRRPTVADNLSMKGKRQLAMLRVGTIEEAEAAERAGIEDRVARNKIHTDRSPSKTEFSPP
jgi:uncharacterized cupin superfamily protein